MTVTHQDKIGAYGNTSVAQPSKNSRATDSRALLRCAGRLQEVYDEKGTDTKKYTEAIRQNQRLWTIFQVALSDPENPLPNDLKINLLSLSRYIDKTSFRVVTEFIPELVKSLIDINRMIASGLMKNPDAASVGVPSGPTPVSESPPMQTSVTVSA